MIRRKPPDDALEETMPHKTYVTEWRDHRGLSQTELAARIQDALGSGFTTSTLRRIEAGKEPLVQAHIEALAEVLKCMPGDLTSRQPDADPRQAARMKAELERLRTVAYQQAEALKDELKANEALRMELREMAGQLEDARKRIEALEHDLERAGRTARH
jgi:transcriptional regulator with XRE-family HTH domain